MGNFSLGEAVLGTSVDLKGLDKGLGEAEAHSKKATTNIAGLRIETEKLDNIVKGAALGGLAAMGVALKFSLDQAAEAQAVMAQTEAVVRSTGGAAGFTAQQIGAMAGRFSELTAFEDEAIQKTANVLLTFTNIRGSNFTGATQAVLDMAAALGTDLQSAAIQVGKALNDPVQGISALQRVGVSFSESQKNVIKQLVAAGDAAKAQQLILEELNREFGGSAAAQLDTYAGKMERLTNAIGNAGEALGNRLLPAAENTSTGLTSLVEQWTVLQDAIASGKLSKFDANVLFARLVTGSVTARFEVQALADEMSDLSQAELDAAAAAADAQQAQQAYGQSLHDSFQGLPDYLASLNQQKTAVDESAAAAQRAADAQRDFNDALGATRGLFRPIVPETGDAAEQSRQLAENIFDLAGGLGESAIATDAAFGPVIQQALDNYALKTGLINQQTAAATEAMRQLLDPTRQLTDVQITAGLQGIQTGLSGGTDVAISMRDAIADVNYNMGLLAPAFTGAAKASDESGDKLVSAWQETQAKIAQAKNELIRFGELLSALPSTKVITVEVQTTMVGGPGRRQLGGPVEAGLPYIVGERRPELFVPDVDGLILPRVPRGAPTSGVVNYITVNIDAPVSGRADAEYLVWRVVEEIDRRG